MRTRHAFLAGFLLFGISVPFLASVARAAEVNGIYTEPTTKDLGELTKIDFFKGWKFRGWIDGYYVNNFNRPNRAVVNANQGASVVKGSNATIEGRTFDIHYDWSDTFYTELYVVNGWNVTVDNNNGKTFGPSIGWSPSPQFSFYLNYLVGPEQNNNTTNYRHLIDSQVNLTPIDPLNIGLNFDYGFEFNNPAAIAAGTGKNAEWWDLTGYLRYKVTEKLEPVVRVEYYRDADTFTTGVKQSLQGYTFTLNYKLDVIKGTALLLRPEIRYDKSSAPFFSDRSGFQRTNNQTTVGIGLVYYW